MYGKLYIVSTPIGNLSDMTYRAVCVLKSVDIIAAEDTRHTKELLNHFEIDTKLLSCHEHNEYDKAKIIINEIKEGKNVAIVSDAGTPIISDPGQILVREAIKEDIFVTAVPGPCAAINALVMSGIDARNYVFIGFLPENVKERREVLDDLIDETKTMVFYVSPHNLNKDLEDLINTFSEDRYASIAREMTKIHEENVRGSLSYLHDYYKTNAIKGEFVIIIEGKDKELLKNAAKEKWEDMSIMEHMNYYQKLGFSEKDAMKKVAHDRDIDKRDIYKLLKVKE